VPLPIANPTTMAPDHRAERRSRPTERRNVQYLPDDPLLRAAEGAAETGRAVSTFWRDVRAGRLPAPVYVGPRMPRWRRSELRAAMDACPRQKPKA
jgi:predicted DNA-binding transcriptional regulator AlpA